MWYDLVDHDDSSFSFPVPMPRRHSLSEPVLEQEGTSYKPPFQLQTYLTACKTINTSDYKFTPPPPPIQLTSSFPFLGFDLLSKTYFDLHQEPHKPSQNPLRRRKCPGLISGRLRYSYNGYLDLSFNNRDIGTETKRDYPGFSLFFKLYHLQVSINITKS